LLSFGLATLMAASCPLAQPGLASAEGWHWSPEPQKGVEAAAMVPKMP